MPVPREASPSCPKRTIWAKSRQWGVTGVPTFVAARYGVVGAQPYEVLVQLMEKAGARRRA